MEIKETAIQKGAAPQFMVMCACMKGEHRIHLVSHGKVKKNRSKMAIQSHTRTNAQNATESRVVAILYPPVFIYHCTQQILLQLYSCSESNMSLASGHHRIMVATQTGPS
ncbi:uncharacterized protein TrAtP1_011292 [Trichoderma atroviride]|uniref:Uncharacterized protein n=1 Tax=Hypocrea atroviridis (strain ATCC 20476 / IMI 206040) TaxID=452589 RepID=G9P7Y0_HYPAI|nr:uncharacterized protein TRIATDRAFT_302121 [Trichoderma atroviride IMI 206040]EHK41667.1 hypothetical protein TRIATDRAFT_302121 [Trichoderma atroviride IMI 206040]UKZ70304.1 hypothetical protein TrAtP1_011292 [Trichoderma atroviride]